MTVDVNVCDTELGDGSHVRDLGIPTVSDAGVHDPAAIVSGKVVGQHLRHGVPVAGREVRPEALVHSACRVFQPRRRPAELVEACERGVEVGLVENFAAADQVAVDRQNIDVVRHSASKPSCEVPCAAWVTTTPRLLSRCTASM